MKKILCLIMLLSFICVGLLSACTPIHVPIKEDDVQDVIIYDSKFDSSSYKHMTQEEISDLVSWFNDCTDIRLNSEFAGEVTIVGIVITTSDSEITILDSGENFEIQVYTSKKNQAVSYWAKQKNIEALLETINTPIEES